MGTVTVTLILDLPEDIAEKAESSGVLKTKNVERLIAQEVERRARADEYIRILDELRALQPPLTQEEIDEEIRLYREEKRQRKAHLASA
jgi:hypothetical protein